MTPEELLKPRYKVIASYPNNLNGLGTIIFCDTKSTEEFYNRFPHLFKKLKWWEERKIEELPKYIKYAGKVHEIRYEAHSSYITYKFDNSRGNIYADFKYGVYPATEEEFLNQQK